MSNTPLKTTNLNLLIINIFFYLIVLGFCSCASIKTSFEYDVNTDFSQFKTFAFFKPGIDKAKISDLDKRRIMSSIETTLSLSLIHI